MMQHEDLPLFAESFRGTEVLSIAEGATLLRNFVSTEELLPIVDKIASQSPFRHMITPGGHKMSAAMTNCGTVGWVSDRQGYRYSPSDPLMGKCWPAMPESFLRLAQKAAALVGFEDYTPDACLINRYVPGAKLSMHQDKNERDFRHPVVSVSIGLPAPFLLSGLQRTGKPHKIPLLNGDVFVLGGPARLYFHGIQTIREGFHPITGKCRICLTFRKALLC